MLIKNFISSERSLKDKYIMSFNRLKKYFYIYKTKNKRVQFSMSSENISAMKGIINCEMDRLQSDLLIKEARLSTENIYRGINGERIKVEGIMKWNFDYENKFIFKNNHYSDIKIKDNTSKSDVKNPWESSRFYHMLLLARAFRIERNRDYYDKFLSDYESWNKQNIFNYSVNWTVSMEVSIRIVNFIESVLIFRDNDILLKEEINNFNDFIYKHYIYISNNLEKGLNSNNHYLSNLVAIIWISVYFINLGNEKTSRMFVKSLNFSIEELERELDYQIYEDGFSYEDSIPYHGLNTEMIVCVIDLLEKNKIQIPRAIIHKAKAMVIALKSVMVGNDIPIIGDLDNGRLMILNVLANKNKGDFKYLIDYSMYVLRKVDKEFLKPSVNLPLKFDQAGLYILSNQFMKIVIRCGEIGVNGIGGHAHNDQLSFIMSVGDKIVFTDPGTGTYSGDFQVRYNLRRTASHNTLSIKNHEQNNIDNLFRMIPNTNSKVISFSKNEFVGQHSGYLEQLGVIYKRKILLRENKVIIYDELSKTINESTNVNFILNKGFQANLVDNYIVITNGVNALKFESEGDLSIENNQLFSDSYGSWSYTLKIVVKTEEKKNKTIITLMN